MKPFRIDVPDDVLEDLRARLARTRWPEAEWSTTGARAHRWLHPRSGRLLGRGIRLAPREALLNRFDQFITAIDGLDIHFIHQRSAA